MSRLLVLDDQEGVAYSTGVLLRRAGYCVDTCCQVDKAISLARRNHYDVVISDLRLEKMSGIDFLSWLRQQSLDAEVIIMTAFASIETAVDAMRQGAFDYISKPFDADDLLRKVRGAIEKNSHSAASPAPHETHCAIGSAPGFVQSMERARALAQADCNVLLTGETGAGKTLLARVMHQCSARAAHPFVSVNCANLSDQLLESELFGCKKGAFTGADASRPGLCEAANRGTLFLDEVGATSPAVQSKLLTLLEDKMVRPLGETRAVPVDIRVIAATNADLHALIARHLFREDLFYRLNVATIHLRPLRERPEDIPVLARHFLEVYARKHGKRVKGLEEPALRCLQHYRFPGNVRELESIIERSILAAPGDSIRPCDLDLPEQFPAPTDDVDPESPDERENIRKTIAASKYNLRKSAEILGISRATLYRKLNRYGLEPR